MTFIEHYDLKKNEFKECQMFTLISPDNEAVQWPLSSGVYVIWEKVPNEMNKLIYIGMTGKFSRNSNNGTVIFNEAIFQSRATRWTPYRFCEHERDNRMIYHFRYGPKERNTARQGQIKYDINAYKKSIPYKSLEIHCFHINSDHNSYSPILLESELLTKYLKTEESLPPANNSL